MTADDDFLGWLIPARCRIQEDMLKLWQLREHFIDKVAFDENVKLASWLIGAGFSLWRAVFLADVPSTVAQNVTTGMVYLQKILLHNSITYRDDKQSWPFGYYINNARFRLVTAADGLLEQTTELTERVSRLKNGLAGIEMDPCEAWHVNPAICHCVSPARATAPKSSPAAQ
jgi:hypothetical protein